MGVGPTRGRRAHRSTDEPATRIAAWIEFKIQDLVKR
jgi:hypothetical protein